MEFWKLVFDNFQKSRHFLASEVKNSIKRIFYPDSDDLYPFLRSDCLMLELWIGLYFLHFLKLNSNKYHLIKICILN